jgi:uncharacterized phage-associated protein
MPLNFQPKIEKIVELLLYLAHLRPDRDKYQAVKLFYLADREHLRRYGRPITHEAYYALDYGPVASNALDLLNGNLGALKVVGMDSLPFRTEIANDSQGKPTTYIREPKRAVNLDLFSKSDLRVFEEIVKEHGGKNFNELFELTHNHLAYKKAWDSKPFFMKRAAMLYEDMIDDDAQRAALVEDLESIAANME